MGGIQKNKKSTKRERKRSERGSGRAVNDKVQRGGLGGARKKRDHQKKKARGVHAKKKLFSQKKKEKSRKPWSSGKGSTEQRGLTNWGKGKVRRRRRSGSPMLRKVNEMFKKYLFAKPRPK